MNRQNKKWSLAVGMAAALLSWSSPSFSQVFDIPASDFVLEPIDGESIFPNWPLTLNAGNFDPSVEAAGELTLNEVVVAGVTAFRPEEEGGGLIHRYWTIVHDSASDTRSLVQTPPSDIVVTDGAQPFYFFPDSLQLLDLNRDGSDDIGVLGLNFPAAAGSSVAGNFKFVKADVFGPAGVFGIPSKAGPNFFETSLNRLGQQTDSSIPIFFANSGTQPSLASADFDGDGNVDLALYDFIIEGDTAIQVAVSLQNDGTLVDLPRANSALILPAGLLDGDFAYNLVAADIDGDGAPDLAITFDSVEGNGGEDMLFVFKGNGDGTFVSDPIASVTIGTDVGLLSLTVGDFDGNDFLDFAVSSTEEFALPEIISAQLNVVLCNPGSPATCSVSAVGFPEQFLPLSLASADFDEDGLDDLAIAYLQCAEADCMSTLSGVGAYLNQDGSFNAAADQDLPLGGAPDNRIIVQVVAKDIDACGGPDLAYTGFTTPENPNPVLNLKGLVSGQGEAGGEFSSYASIAFNHNEDPVADAGEPVQTDEGIRVGGAPTCSGEVGEVLSIQWEVISGSAQFSDTTAANPIVSSDGTVVLQVTCSDACGADSVSTVTIDSSAFLLNGTGCSLGHAAQGGLTWLLGLVGLLPLAVRRLRA